MPTLKEIYVKFYPNLVAVLPMDDATFMAQLYSNNLLPGDGKAKVEAQQTRADKASYFLDNYVEKGFVVDDSTNPTFYSLLSVMQSNDDPLLKSVAGTIKKSNICVCVVWSAL